MSASNKHINYDELIARYLSGETSIDEVLRLESWVKEDELNKKHFIEFKRAWQLSNSASKSIDTNKAWNKIEGSIVETGKDTNVIHIKAKKSNTIFYRMAASIIVLLSVGLMLYFLLSNKNVELIANDSTLTEWLIDGSEITLNVNSSLTVLKNFNKKERLVKLSGDAFFDVKPNPEKPFIINAGEATIKVLGTSFYVNAKTDSPEIEVTVTTGKVAMISETGEEINLIAGETGRYNKQIEQLVKEETKDQNVLSWKTRKIKFENTSLLEVISVLSKTYDVHIQFENSDLENCRLTANFDHQSLANVLLIIEETLDITSKKTDNTIILSGNGCK